MNNNASLTRMEFLGRYYLENISYGYTILPSNYHIVKIQEVYVRINESIYLGNYGDVLKGSFNLTFKINFCDHPIGVFKVIIL